jgi:hypothetical protein
LSQPTCRVLIVAEEQVYVIEAKDFDPETMLRVDENDQPIDEPKQPADE